MAKKESGCLYLILGVIALAILMWVLKNIIGLVGLALAGWAGYRLYQKYNNKEQYKLEAVFMGIGLLVGIGWFAVAPNTPPNDQATPPSTQSSLSSQNTNQLTSSKEETTSTPNTEIYPDTVSIPIIMIAGVVTSVIDGDTAHIRLANGKEEKVRFIGLDTPETKHPSQPVESYGQESAQFTTSQLTGKQVYLETDVNKRDNYGRLLAYVWTNPPKSTSDSEIRSKMFNATLLQGGYAQLMTISPNVKYVDYFTTYQKEARVASKGLWGIEFTEAEPASTPSQTVSTEAFVGSSKSDKYHYPYCQWAKKINPANLVEFSSSEEARKAGYVPCKVCSPP